MTYNFDQLIDRRQTDSLKWREYAADVLPMWVADMDFLAPAPVIQALQERVAHGVFGYALPPKELELVICERLARLYRWAVSPEQILFLPGLVSGINIVCRAFGQPGDGVVVQTPVYPPFLSAPVNHGLTLQIAPLTLIEQGQIIRYDIDYDAFESTVTPRTKLFILCHPHNPTGYSYRREQLTRLAEICLRHQVIICSDEIHNDLLLGDTPHTPIAALSPDIAQHCITLMAPSKTYNIPGLGCSFAVVQNPELLKCLKVAMTGIVPWINVLGLTAALVAYRDGEEWLTEVRRYLTANRDFLVDYVTANMPTIRTTIPEATYLAWLDCRQAGIEGNPHEFFLQQAKVALNDGATFGTGGEGFVRLNFGCPRSRLAEALERMKLR